MKYAVLDFETTGDQPGKSDIIQVGLVIVNEQTIEHTYSSFVKPSAPIPPFIRSLTGITDEMVQDAPLMEDVVNEIIPLLSDCTLVGHNVGFDLAFLQHALTDAGYSPFTGRTLDTLDWLRVLFPTLTSYQLSYVSASLGVKHERPHQADSDAEATALLWIKCLEKLDLLPSITLERLSFLFSHPDFASYDLTWFLNEIIEKRSTEDADSQRGGRVYRQFALGVDDWLSGEQEEEREAVSIPFQQFYADIKQRIRSSIAEYEERPSQEKMMEAVAEALEAERHLVIEAGTGTGKSLGYLLPSIHYALSSKEKVVISTHTINLQEQLRTKELPMMHELSPVPFSSAVLKGRSHYLCLRKFEHKVNAQDFQNDRDDRITAAQMVVWLGETAVGDEEELNLAGNKGSEFWSHVASDADSCLNRACPWFKTCFYHRARSEANEADIIITNHSLLLTDAKAEHRILPAYGRLIVDEAHHFEEVASQHLGFELSYFSMVSGLVTLLKDSRSGQLPLLQTLLGQSGEASLREWGEKLQQLPHQIVKVKDTWDELYEGLFDRFIARTAQSADGGPVTVRLRTDALPPDWKTFAGMEDNIYITLTEILKTLDKALAETKESDDFGLESLVTDISGTVKNLYRSRDALRLFMKADDKNMVYWMEASGQFKSKSLRLYAAPIDVSHLIREYFWDRKDSIVMTSATLTVEKSFQYVKDQLGLAAEGEEQGRVATVQLPSPFKYRDQALVLIPRDFPGLKGANMDPLFLERLVQSLSEAAVVTNGRMLVLFTSNKMLKQTHAPLKEALQPHGIHVLGQGVDSGNRSKLTRLFMQSPAAVLLGTSSFWEGVDIPGEALTALAIVRLPFQPPNHPMVEAKSEFIKARNQNPFSKLSVPQAVIRFKQGFGRLVRTARDRGIVIIYDTRVIETSYGKHFLYSLPGPKIEHLPTDRLPDRMREWLEMPESAGKENEAT
ncbi:ATP-dependent DNA helicase DinG [Paenibacillus thermotolerans]|uniref:ATP-dependent DNA helicase DinG n=1 Tax=Paenibacillus thermotolerans TaxID=3027807 RepID=UPI00236786AB|nr:MULTISPECIES: ATP-dependent DNA helicase DinG [unclassified Paenibacillus]